MEIYTQETRQNAAALSPTVNYKTAQIELFKKNLNARTSTINEMFVYFRNTVLLSNKDFRS